MDKYWVKQYQIGVPEEINPNEYQSLPEIFAESFKKYANQVAFSNFNTNISYAKIDDLSRKFAAYLQSLGLEKGSRIAVMLPNLIQYPVAIIAILRAGFTVVNINPMYTTNELIEQINDSESTAIIVLAGFASTVSHAISQMPSIRHVIVTEIGDCFPTIKRYIFNFVTKYIIKMIPDYSALKFTTFNDAIKIGALKEFKEPVLKHDDIAFIQYTGGTTGIAKGATLTHKNLVANILQTTSWIIPLYKKNPQIIVTALPLYHIFSLTANFFTFFKIGAKNILITDPRDTKNFIKQIKHAKFTAITGVNTLFNSLLNHPHFHKINFKHLQITLSGGMALQKDVARRWQKVTNLPILEAYGLTETSPAVTINPLSTKQYTGSIGLPLPSTEISIRDENGKELPIDEIGELCIRGPQVMPKYWHKEQESKSTFWKDGYLRTGDSARIDTLGYIYLVDRIKDLIIVSGFNVYPHQVEEVILKIPGIKEAAAISTTLSDGKEAVKACVVAESANITADDIISYCKEHLTAYKVPKVVEFYKELPKSNIGKVLKRKLS